MHKQIPLLLLLLLQLNVVASISPGLLPVGSEARRFLIMDLQGKRVGLRDFLGKASGPKLVLLNFWSVTCIPCRSEMPELQKWAEKYPSEVQLLFINLDPKTETDKVQDFLKKYNINPSRVLLDFYQATAKNYQVCKGTTCSVPSLFAVDANGIIRLASAGFDASKNLSAQLDNIFNQVTIAVSPATSPITTGITNSNLPNQAKFQILHDALINIPLDETAARNGISRQQLIEIFKETEAAAKRQWNLP